MRATVLSKSAEKAIREPDIVVQKFTDDGTYPNSALPMLIYQRALNLPAEDAEFVIEEILRVNHWGDTWCNGVYAYPHYHSTAHEVLLCSSGSATLRLGAGTGVTATIGKGDVVVIPAGVVHEKVDATDDFAVVGAYPPGQKWDMNYGKEGERPKADENIARVPLPKTDPVYGVKGPLMQHWRA